MTATTKECFSNSLMCFHISIHDSVEPYQVLRVWLPKFFVRDCPRAVNGSAVHFTGPYNPEQCYLWPRTIYSSACLCISIWTELIDIWWLYIHFTNNSHLIKLYRKCLLKPFRWVTKECFSIVTLLSRLSVILVWSTRKTVVTRVHPWAVDTGRSGWCTTTLDYL